MGEASLPDPKQQKMVGATLPFSILLPSLVAQNIKYKVPNYQITKHTSFFTMQSVKRTDLPVALRTNPHRLQPFLNRRLLDEQQFGLKMMLVTVMM